MFFYKLTLSYDGTNYSGWQIQPNAPSIQEHIQNVLKRFLSATSMTVIGSGRTDAGVHALNQVAHFKWPLQIDLYLLQKALNGMLPKDIRIKKIEFAYEGFHAQHDAISKEYHYVLFLEPVINPFSRLYCWHVRAKMNLDILVSASKHFIGTHDFTAFANEAHKGSAAKNPIRTIHRLDIREMSEGLRLEFEGDGFLYGMVRNIVGTLVSVASLKRPIEDISLIFSSKDRRLASPAAPAQGLFLANVTYPNASTT